jgi:hypothetical protein
MRKSATKGHRAGKQKQRIVEGGTFKRGRAAIVLQRESRTGRFRMSKARFEAVMKAAARSGLLSEKSSRIGGRISPALIEQAKKQTGIETDTDLIEFALAIVALADNFSEAFKQSRGKVADDLKLGY